MRTNPKALIVAGILLLGVIAFALTRGAFGGDHVSTKNGKTTQSARPGQSDNGASGKGSTSSSGGTAFQSSSALPAGGSPDAPLPLDLSTSSTSNLGDGDTVTIHATAKDGKALYGYEARLCAADQTYKYDADMRPSLLGKCISKPLSSVSDNYTKVAAAAPFQVVDGSFRVGVGSDSYQTQDGRDITITCDHDHPCMIVIKLQFTDGYGFQAVKVTYR